MFCVLSNCRYLHSNLADDAKRLLAEEKSNLEQANIECELKSNEVQAAALACKDIKKRLDATTRKLVQVEKKSFRLIEEKDSLTHESEELGEVEDEEDQFTVNFRMLICTNNYLANKVVTIAMFWFRINKQRSKIK